MPSKLESKLRASLRARAEQGLLRRLRSGCAGIDFCSNDYLGLSADPDFRAVIDAATSTSTDTGSTGSRLVSGNSAAVESLESRIAEFHHGETALLFGSGYTANLALFACLLGKGDTLITDRLAHASILDGAQLGRARHLRFRHNDLGSLESRLRAAEGSIVIGIESVYSMDGDCAPLADIVELADRYGASLIVDEAHSVGVEGPAGAGCVVAAGLEHRVFARLFTFGKALGLHGAAVVGPALLREYLVNFARPFIYSTAPPPQAVAGIRAAYDYLPGLDATRDRLRDRIGYFRTLAESSGLDWLDSHTAIQSVIIPGNAEVRRVAAALRAAGLYVVPIVAPTVPAGTERIRITVHASNTNDEIDRLFDALAMATAESTD